MDNIIKGIVSGKSIRELIMSEGMEEEYGSWSVDKEEEEKSEFWGIPLTDGEWGYATQLASPQTKEEALEIMNTDLEGQLYKHFGDDVEIEPMTREQYEEYTGESNEE